MAVSVGQVVTDCSCVSVPLKVCHREQGAPNEVHASYFKMITYTAIHIFLDKGASIKYVHKIFGILDPPLSALS